MEAVTGRARLLAVLEGINDLENLGALFRNAAAFGVDGVLLDPRCADPLYRRCIRVSVGQVLHVPWTRVANWPGTLDELRADGFELIALTPDPSATPLWRVQADGSRRALLLGSEGGGLSPEALARRPGGYASQWRPALIPSMWPPPRRWRSTSARRVHREHHDHHEGR